MFVSSCLNERRRRKQKLNRRSVICEHVLCLNCLYPQLQSIGQCFSSDSDHFPVLETTPFIFGKTPWWLIGWKLFCKAATYLRATNTHHRGYLRDLKGVLTDLKGIQFLDFEFVTSSSNVGARAQLRRQPNQGVGSGGAMREDRDLTTASRLVTCWVPDSLPGQQGGLGQRFTYTDAVQYLEFA